ncbi:MAG: L-rhamnose mutarotase [Bacteroidota bacterium]
MKKHYFCLDLKDQPELIETYKKYHQPGGVWPEILQSIQASGISQMEIFLAGNRLFMIMEVDENFDMEAKARANKNDPKVQEWEELMWKFQQALPFADEGVKWVEMEQIFNLNQH